MLLLITVSFSLPNAANAELTCTETPIKVALFDFSPFYSPDAQGQAQGIIIDELQRFMDEIGCQWQGRFYTASTMIEKIANGQADLAMIIDHPMLKGKANYSHAPIMQMQLTSYQNQSSPGIQQFDQLKQQRVIAIRGYGYGGLFEKLIDPSMQVDLHIASDIEIALQLLDDNQGDYLLSYQRPTNAVLAGKSRPNIHSSRLQSKGIYFVISPEYRDGELLDSLNRLIDSKF